MIKKIIACSDIHVPSLRKIGDYKDTLSKFIEQCKEIVKDEGPENVRIVVAGDIFENKISVTNESIMAVNWFFKQLDETCQTYVIAGNHDLLMNNLDRTDSLTPIFDTANYKNVKYLDRELEYKSGHVVDDDCVFCLYSTFDDFNSPNIEALKIKYPDKHFIGLIHGDVNGAVSPTNYVSDNGLDPRMFKGLDFVIAGHIHKFQEIRQEGVPIVYCSSIRQKDFGESITEHGFVLWENNGDEFDYSFVEVDNSDGGYYKFSINDLKDIENDEEELINL